MNVFLLFLASLILTSVSTHANLFVMNTQMTDGNLATDHLVFNGSFHFHAYFGNLSLTLSSDNEQVCSFIIMQDLETLAAGDGREDCSLPGLKKRPNMEDLTDYITDFMLTIKPRSLDLFQQQLTFTLSESVENIQTNDLPVFIDATLRVGPKIFPLSQGAKVTYFAAFEMFQICFEISANAELQQFETRINNMTRSSTTPGCVDYYSQTVNTSATGVLTYLFVRGSFRVYFETIDFNLTVERPNVTDLRYNNESRKYYIVLPADTLSLPLARAGCDAIGFHLPEPKNPQENDFLDNLDSFAFMLGMTSDRHKRNWSWQSDGSPVTWFNWRAAPELSQVTSQQVCALMLRNSANSSTRSDQWEVIECNDSNSSNKTRASVQLLKKSLVCERSVLAPSQVAFVLAIFGLVLVASILSFLVWSTVKLASPSREEEEEQRRAVNRIFGSYASEKEKSSKCLPVNLPSIREMRSSSSRSRSGGRSLPTTTKEESYSSEGKGKTVTFIGDIGRDEEKPKRSSGLSMFSFFTVRTKSFTDTTESPHSLPRVEDFDEDSGSTKSPASQPSKSSHHTKTPNPTLPDILMVSLDQQGGQKSFL